MSKITQLHRRIDALEPKAVAAEREVHRILCDGQTRDEALDAYGRDRIHDGDILIVRTIVDGGAPCANMQ